MKFEAVTGDDDALRLARASFMLATALVDIVKNKKAIEEAGWQNIIGGVESLYGKGDTAGAQLVRDFAAQHGATGRFK